MSAKRCIKRLKKRSNFTLKYPKKSAKFGNCVLAETKQKIQFVFIEKQGYFLKIKYSETLYSKAFQSIQLN
jgi:hypothetical protein